MALGTAYQRRPDQNDGHGNRKGVDQEFRGKRYRTSLTMTVTKVKGMRTRRRRSDGEHEGIAFTPKKRIDVVGRQSDVREVIGIIDEAIRTGRVGVSRVFVTKARIDLFASDKDGEKVVDAFCNAALNGDKGAGRIFAYPVESRGRIRTKRQGSLTTQGTT